MQACKVALVQMSCTPDIEDNCEKAFEQVRQAAKGGAQIVCLQELFSGQYFCQQETFEPFQQAEPVPGPLTDRLSRVSFTLKSCSRELNCANCAVSSVYSIGLSGS